MTSVTIETSSDKYLKQVSVIYKDLSKLKKSLGDLGLYSLQYMLEQVNDRFEQEIFTQIKNSPE